jgi:hypothetical protein
MDLMIERLLCLTVKLLNVNGKRESPERQLQCKDGNMSLLHEFRDNARHRDASAERGGMSILHM